MSDYEPHQSKPYVIRDSGNFAMIPLWILEKASDRAVRLYGIMGAKYGHFTIGQYENIYPSQKRLAKDLDCSVKSVQRALSELETIGALVIEIRLNENNGGQTSNQYTLISVKRNNNQVEYKPLSSGGSRWLR